MKSTWLMLFVLKNCSQFYCLSIGAKQFGAVLGEVVMEGNVVIFDRGNHRVGFASSNVTDPETGRPCGKSFSDFAYNTLSVFLCVIHWKRESR